MYLFLFKGNKKTYFLKKKFLVIGNSSLRIVRVFSERSMSYQVVEWIGLDLFTFSSIIDFNILYLFTTGIVPSKWLEFLFYFSSYWLWWSIGQYDKLFLSSLFFVSVALTHCIHLEFLSVRIEYLDEIQMHGFIQMFFFRQLQIFWKMNYDHFWQNHRRLREKNNRKAHCLKVIHENFSVRIYKIEIK